MNVIHLADEKAFLHSVCNRTIQRMHDDIDDWTFLTDNVTCQDCLKIINKEKGD